MTVHFRNDGLGSGVVGLATLLAIAACGGSGSANGDDAEVHGLPVDGYADSDGTSAEGTADDAGCRPRLGGPCDPIVQCGCGAGERCVLDYAGRTRPIELCVAAGTDPFGMLCDDGVDNCAAGSQCFREGPSEDGSGFVGTDICAPYCDSNLDCPGGWYCGGLAPGLVPGAPGYQVCGSPPQPCDPFTSEGCAPGTSCVVRAGNTECRGAGAGGPGEHCLTSCAVGSWCPALEWGNPLITDGLCYKYCRLDGGLPDCSDIPGAGCAALLGRPDVGICV
jgi:hypothetical protein